MILPIIILIIYFTLFLLNTAGEVFSFRNKTRLVATPLLMPLLMIWVLSLGERPWLLFIGLIGATLGDIFLMFPEKRDRKFFLFGAFSFSFTHVIYMIYFIRLWERIHVPYYLWIAAAFLAVATAVLYIRMRKNLGKLNIPVAIYSLLLLSTAVIILLSYSVLPLNLYLMALAGILLFLLSDAALSQDWFIKEFRTARPIAMGTYIIAQLLLVRVVVSL